MDRPVWSCGIFVAICCPHGGDGRVGCGEVQNACVALDYFLCNFTSGCVLS